MVAVSESFVDDNVRFCEICALSFKRRAWGKTLDLQCVGSCSILIVCVETLEVIGWVEIDRLLGYVQWGD